jgi:hypothetical protein
VLVATVTTPYQTDGLNIVAACEKTTVAIYPQEIKLQIIIDANFNNKLVLV